MRGRTSYEYHTSTIQFRDKKNRNSLTLVITRKRSNLVHPKNHRIPHQYKVSHTSSKTPSHVRLCQSLSQAYIGSTNIWSFRRDITPPKISIRFIKWNFESLMPTKIRVPLGDCYSYSNHRISRWAAQWWWNFRLLATVEQATHKYGHLFALCNLVWRFRNAIDASSCGFEMNSWLVRTGRTSSWRNLNRGTMVWWMVSKLQLLQDRFGFWNGW